MTGKRIALAAGLLLSLSSISVTADDMRTMGNHYGLMLTNFYMAEDLQIRCKDLPAIDIQNKSVVNELLRTKLGADYYAEVMSQFPEADLNEFAQTQINEVWSQLNGCEDPRLEKIIERIEATHAEAFASLKKMKPVAAN